MESVRLSCRPTGADDFAETKCVICQQITPEKLITTPNGCKRIRAASDIRNDCVSKRMKLMADESNFVYHVSNECYKTLYQCEFAQTHPETRKNARNIAIIRTS